MPKPLERTSSKKPQMPGPKPWTWVFALCMVVGTSALAQTSPIGLRGAPYRGHYKHVFVGASMADSGGLDNGLECLKSQAQTQVDRDLLQSRPNLVSATLYVFGSLLDDGVDAEPDTRIFDSGGLNWDASADRSQILQTARATADREIEFTPPGASAPLTLNVASSVPILEGFRQPGADGNVAHNVAYFVTPIDVTAVINNQGRGVLDGTYTVSGLQADICYGLEAACDLGETCSARSESHVKAAAGFALLLIVEDPAEPLRSISVFEGLSFLFATPDLSPLQLSLTTQSGASISNPAAGEFSIFAIEGDLKEGAPDSAGTGLADADRPCNADDEYIEIDGDDDPTQDGYCLSQADADARNAVDNPRGNLFNSTISSVPSVPSADACAPPYQCCSSLFLCGETGIDIDTFDISAGLTPNATDVRVRIGTGADHVGIAAAVLSVNLFEPILDVDSQVQITNATRDGLVQLGGPVDFTIALSNTGNTGAKNVQVLMDAPPYTEWVDVLSTHGGTPETGGIDLSLVTGGRYGNGLLRIQNITVGPGEVTEIKLRLNSACGGAGEDIQGIAEISFDGGEPFELTSNTVRVRGPGTDACEGLDSYGPFGVEAPEKRYLRGGGGCQAIGMPGFAGLVWFALTLLAIAWRGRKAAIFAPIALVLALFGCASERLPDEVLDETETSRALKSLDDLDGDRCDSRGTMVWVDLGDAENTRFCMDRFEAQAEGFLGNAIQGNDDTAMTPDGSTLAQASVALGVFPSTNITWYQARSACTNAGKDLCTVQEWEAACRGPAAQIYPYGNENNPAYCNGYFNHAEENPSVTGSLYTCGSYFGVYDLSGNVGEWVLSATERVFGSGVDDDRLSRGGSYLSNEHGLKCFGSEFHHPPNYSAPHLGFRCCSAGPPAE